MGVGGEPRAGDPIARGHSRRPRTSARPCHPHTRSSRYNLAGAYESAGNLRQAIPLYKATLAAYKRILGRGHPDTEAVRARLRRARGK
ncbi:tetratricopeptide repeat protein [Amycolatopsis sp. NPDC089917]|uniref:tetratricopeptide repeat protein n=1 Tax=Amycolatopsis sp. NPDC089917 TaxID=3155187 RepID=UPI00341886BC